MFVKLRLFVSVWQVRYNLFKCLLGTILHQCFTIIIYIQCEFYICVICTCTSLHVHMYVLTFLLSFSYFQNTYSFNFKAFSLVLNTIFLVLKLNLPSSYCQPPPPPPPSTPPASSLSLSTDWSTALFYCLFVCFYFGLSLFQLIAVALPGTACCL